MPRRFANSPVFWLLAVTLSLLGLVAPGCAVVAPDVGRVSGTVTFEGQPVTSGEVVFVLENGEQFRCQLKGQCIYEFKDLPVGLVKIAVRTFRPSPFPEPVPGKPKPVQTALSPPAKDKPYIQVPDHYADPDKSGLTLKVEKGEQKYPIVLKR
jgi:hypothetical protein